MIFIYKIVFICPLMLVSMLAQAIMVEYEVVGQSGNHYELEYTVVNDDLAGGLEAFDIFFEYGLYENISAIGSPVGWEDPYVDQPQVFYGTTYDGLVDYIGGPLALGEGLAGFVIGFDWLGTDELSGQYFEAFSLDTFDVLSTGSVNIVSGVTPVPIPGSLWLMALGLSAVSFARRKVV